MLKGNNTVNLCRTVTPQKRPKNVFKTDKCRSKVLQNAQWEHSSIISTFIKLPVVIKIFVLSFFEWLFYTGFTAHVYNRV